MTTNVRVNTYAYATTHVATNMLHSMKQIIRESGLSITRIQGQWAVLEVGIATWLNSGHLERLVLEGVRRGKARWRGLDRPVRLHHRLHLLRRRRRRPAGRHPS